MRSILTAAFILSFTFCHAQKLTTYAKKTYKIQYPDNWIINASGVMGSEFVLFAPQENKDAKFHENINLLIQDLSGKNIDLDKYVQISEDQIEKMTGNKNYEATRMKTGKLSYEKMVYEVTRGELKMKEEQYYFIKNDKAYVLSLTVEAAKYEAAKTTAEQILNSFTIVE